MESEPDGSSEPPRPGEPPPSDEAASAPEDTARTVVCCPSCGALNGADFDRCVRCASWLREDAPARTQPSAAAPPVRRGPGLLAVLAPGSGLVATKLLFGVTTLVFIAHLALSLGRELSASALLLGGSVIDAVRMGALAPGEVALLAAEPWRLWSAVFVHFGVVHFALNMVGLLYLGRIAEPAIGSARTILVYLATGLLGFATTAIYFLLTGQSGLTAGASGALFGIMGLILGILMRRRDPRWKAWATQAVLFSVLFGFAMRVANNSAHLGGLAVGILLGLVIDASGQHPTPRWQRIAAVVGLVGTVVCLVLAQLSPLWRQLELSAG